MKSSWEYLNLQLIIPLNALQLMHLTTLIFYREKLPTEVLCCSGKIPSMIL